MTRKADKPQQQSTTGKHAILRMALCAISTEGIQDFESEALGHFALDLESEARSILEAFDRKEVAA